MTVLVCAVSLGGAATARSDPAASGPPASMFKTGYDKCKLASVSAMSKAAGHTYAHAKFDGKTCTWSSADGSYVVLVDTHPAGYIDLMVPSLGKHPSGERVIRVAGLPKVSKAVLDTHSYANTHRYQKDLFAAYAPGVVQLSMDNATPLPDATLVAVIRLVTRT
jgi:hypothetical protein